jgi:hypothetical protein
MGHLIALEHEHSVPIEKETRVLKAAVRTVRCDVVMYFFFSDSVAVRCVKVSV